MIRYFVSKIEIKYFKPSMKKETCILNIASRYFSNESSIKPTLTFKPNFTAEEQKYILEKLNEDDSEQLRRYSLPKNRIKKLHDWRKKNGKFNNLNDVLLVEGLGVKTVNKLCKNILQGENGNVEEGKEKLTKGRGQMVTPILEKDQANKLKSALGIHLYATGISWARIERDNNSLSDWNVFEFNLGTKKLSYLDALRLVIDVSQEIPTSEVYIFEAPVAVTPAAQQSPISVNAYIQRTQLLSMLMTILSTSFKHNPLYTQSHQQNNLQLIDFSFQSNVFFLRHRLSARLFRTLIGTEQVSAAMTVSNILSNHISDKIVYTPITINENLKSMYSTQLPITKEVLGQALLLTMAFMDVCVYQNPNSLKNILTNNR